ncbi:MAG: tRNA pseudouridine(38-40) synthase TruA [Anaerolineales bacterium]|nr:tRNA pseudouridine(38-40) synthase TruA [Anaerolineales bacterium]
MARYQIILAYDGTDFFGSQRQARTRTVQGELEKALCKLGWAGKSVLLAGRTDTGVHAEGQVAAFDLDWVHGIEDLLKAVNANLPTDMAVKEIHAAQDDFHPRFDAISRRYRYRLFCRDVRDPLRERYAWRIWPPVDGALLSVVSQVWPGDHDFSAFGTSPRPGGKTVRTVMFADWKNDGDEWRFEVQADAFLYRMVRRMVFIQVIVAQGKLQVEEFTRALLTNDTSLVGAGVLPSGLAQPQGLSLVQVCY